MPEHTRDCAGPGEIPISPAGSTAKSDGHLDMPAGGRGRAWTRHRLRGDGVKPGALPAEPFASGVAYELLELSLSRRDGKPRVRRDRRAVGESGEHMPDQLFGFAQVGHTPARRNLSCADVTERLLAEFGPVHGLKLVSDVVRGCRTAGDGLHGPITPESLEELARAQLNHYSAALSQTTP